MIIKITSEEPTDGPEKIVVTDDVNDTESILQAHGYDPSKIEYSVQS